MSINKLVKLASYFENKYLLKEAQAADPFEGFMERYMAEKRSRTEPRKQVSPQLSKKYSELGTLIETAKGNARSAAMGSTEPVAKLFNEIIVSLSRLKAKIAQNNVTKEDGAALQAQLNKAIVANSTAVPKVRDELILSLRDNFQSISNSAQLIAELKKPAQVSQQLAEKQKKLNDLISSARIEANQAALSSVNPVTEMFGAIVTSLDRLRRKISQNTVTKQDVADIQYQFNKALLARRDTLQKAPNELVVALKSNLDSLNLHV